MSLPTDKDLKAAEARFWALAGRAPPPVEQHPELRRFEYQSGATEGFIARNEERIAKGLPPLRANGDPITAPAAPAPAASNPATDTFFSDAQPNIKRHNT